IHRDCEGCLMQGCIMADHHIEFHLFAPLFREGYADESAAVGSHEVYYLRCNQLGSTDEVALILPVFVVNYNHNPAGPDLLNGFYYCIQIGIFSHLKLVWWVPIYPFQSLSVISQILLPALHSSTGTGL